MAHRTELNGSLLTAKHDGLQQHLHTPVRPYGANVPLFTRHTQQLLHQLQLVIGISSQAHSQGVLSSQWLLPFLQTLGP